MPLLSWSWGEPDFVPMLLDTSFSPRWERLAWVSNEPPIRVHPRQSAITFAISLHPLFSPRICCNVCSSPGVQGVLVLPFFFIVVTAVYSVDSVGVAAMSVAVAAAAIDPPGRVEGIIPVADGEGIVPGAEEAGCEMRRFRGLVSVGDVTG